MKEYLDLMFEIAQEGGRISLDVLENMEVNFKQDASVITEADLTISKLVHQKLSPLLSNDDHILIDEEDPKSSDYLNEESINHTKYIWSVDPIDGTRPYSNGIPTYGISIGVLKEAKPWMGVVYFPLLNELFYCDADNAFFVRHAFTDHEMRRKIVPIDEDLSNASIFYGDEAFYKRFSWDSSDCRTMIPASAVVHFCWPTIGRGCGSLLRVALWDMAGSWPIVQRAGLEFRDFDTGEVFDRLELKRFQHERSSWKTKNYHILSSEKNYALFKQRLSKKARST